MHSTYSMTTSTLMRYDVLLVFIVLLNNLLETEAFSSSVRPTVFGHQLVGGETKTTVFPNHHHQYHHRHHKIPTVVFMKNSVSEDESSISTTPATNEKDGSTTTMTGEKKMSLEDKMKTWEASEEEIKAASLGGIVPIPQGRERTEAFDVGLYIAFPIMVITGLAFAFFPLIMGSIDVGDIEVPRV